MDLQAITEGAQDDSAGVAEAARLVALAEALVGEDDARLAEARRELAEALGSAGLVEAVAVVSNFERMVRIADSTGIPIDAPLVLLSEDLRDDLGLERFAAAAHTPSPGLAGRLAGRLLRPLVQGGLRALGRRQGGKA